MIRRQWNALCVGDHVLVHDTDVPALSLVPGRVTQVETDSGANLVTIRIAAPGKPAREVRPKRLVVHLDSGEATERCWRCEVRTAPVRTDRSRENVTRARRPTTK